MRTVCKGMKWLVLSMLVSLSGSEFCLDSGSCSCQRTSIWKWKIQCPSAANPKYIVRIDNAIGKWQVKCHDVTSWSEFRYQLALPLSSPRFGSTLTIERCPLPDEPFGHIAKRFGLPRRYTLTFTSHMNLSSTLTQQHLSMLSGIDRLFLSSNGLTKLPSDLFRDLGTLVVLDLSSNKIATLPYAIFHGLSELRQIDLSYNEMRFVDWRLFGNCTWLHKLSLKGNLLTSLDYWPFREFRHVFVSEFPKNRLEYVLNYASVDMVQMALDISENEFTKLPEKLPFAMGLTEFRLSHNRGNLTTLPMDFLNNSTKLRNVTLIRNNWSSLPENIFWGSFSVRSIDLHGNSLSTLPENIFRDSSRLIHLDLSDNDLTHLPEGLFRALTNLRDLNLAGNGIASLSQNIFGNLTSLLDLNLGSNNINKVHHATFSKLANIRMVRLSNNSVGSNESLMSFLDTYFDGSTIQTIFLDHNNLTRYFFIEGINYPKPDNLLLVDLRYNQITNVSVWSPSIGSPEVEYDLRHNNILEVTIDEKISSKVNILVDDNPFDCGCHIYYSLRYMHEIRERRSGENLEIEFGNASCSGPDWMKGIPVASLQPETFTCRPDVDDRYEGCAKGCDCWWRPHDKTRIVNCSSRDLGKPPDRIIGFVLEDDGYDNKDMLETNVDSQTILFDWGRSRVELDLANNSLTDIPTLRGTGYEYVEWLILSHNFILKLSFDVLPPRLTTLHLDHNYLKNFDQVALNAIFDSTTLKKLNIEGNPLSCDSDTQRALDFMEEQLNPNLRYSVQTCLDARNPPNTKKAPAIYISYTIF